MDVIIIHIKNSFNGSLICTYAKKSCLLLKQEKIEQVL